MYERIYSAKEFLASSKHRLTVGLIITGLGIGLVISAYLKVPHEE